MKKNTKIVKLKPGAISPFKRIENFPDHLAIWAQAYLEYEATTSEKSRRVQMRDIGYFLKYMVDVEGSDSQDLWTPRLTKSFIDYLRSTVNDKGTRKWGDRTINRILAHLKTFAKWVHRWRKFPLGNPMEKIRMNSISNGLEIERALTPGEVNRILDAADRLPAVGGRSKDRNRYRKAETRPQRKGYRPYRDRAIIYVLVNTGMRRGGLCSMTLENVDFKRKTIKTIEKGGIEHTYAVNRQGLDALREYLENERLLDNEKWQSTRVFLPEKSQSRGGGALNAQTINRIWNQVAALAGIEGKSPHSCRHAIGKLIMEKTGNVAAVQRQLGHKNAQYSMQYARITRKELDQVLEQI